MIYGSCSYFLNIVYWWGIGNVLSFLKIWNSTSLVNCTRILLSAKDQQIPASGLLHVNLVTYKFLVFVKVLQGSGNISTLLQKEYLPIE